MKEQCIFIYATLIKFEPKMTGVRIFFLLKSCLRFTKRPSTWTKSLFSSCLTSSRNIGFSTEIECKSDLLRLFSCKSFENKYHWAFKFWEFYLSNDGVVTLIYVTFSVSLTWYTRPKMVTLFKSFVCFSTAGDTYNRRGINVYSPVIFLPVSGTSLCLGRMNPSR